MLKIGKVLQICLFVSACTQAEVDAQRVAANLGSKSLEFSLSPPQTSAESNVRFTVIIYNKSDDKICYSLATPSGDTIGLEIFSTSADLQLHTSEVSELGLGGPSDFARDVTLFEIKELPAGESITLEARAEASWYDYFMDENTNKVREHKAGEYLLARAVLGIASCDLKNETAFNRMKGLTLLRSQFSAPFRL